jgi:carbon storage regulator CsrA
MSRLNLTRCEGERVMVYVPPSDKETQIEIMVTEIDRKRIKMSIDAPRDVEILRSELLARRRS